MTETFARVAFKVLDNQNNQIKEFKFAINPQNIQDSYSARNVFQQTATSQLMQGYGAGPHTIVINGTTGVNQRLDTTGGVVNRDDDTGYAKLLGLKDVILKQLNNAHDASTEAGLGTSLVFCNYTSYESWIVELDSNAFEISQSSDDPLSYYYKISMVVLAPYYQPMDREISTVSLGNIQPEISSVPLNNSQLDSDLNNRQRLYSMNLTDRSYDDVLADASYDTQAQILDRGNIPGVSSIENKYNVSNDGVFDLRPLMDNDMLYTYYSSLYTDKPRSVYLMNDSKPALKLNIYPSSPYWKDYWKLYLRESSSANGSGKIGYLAGPSDKPLSITLTSTSNGKDTGIDNVNTSQNNKDFFNDIYYQDWGSAILQYGEIDRGQSLLTASVDTLQQAYRKFFTGSGSDDVVSRFLRCAAMYDLTNKVGEYGFSKGQVDGGFVSESDMEILYSLFYGTSMNSVDYQEYANYYRYIVNANSSLGYNFKTGSYDNADMANFNQSNTSLDKFHRVVVEPTIYDRDYRNNTGIPEKALNGYLNPLVSLEAPKYAYAEITNVLQF